MTNRSNPSNDASGDEFRSRQRNRENEWLARHGKLDEESGAQHTRRRRAEGDVARMNFGDGTGRMRPVPETPIWEAPSQDDFGEAAHRKVPSQGRVDISHLPGAEKQAPAQHRAEAKSSSHVLGTEGSSFDTMGADDDFDMFDAPVSDEPQIVRKRRRKSGSSGRKPHRVRKIVLIVAAVLVVFVGVSCVFAYNSIDTLKTQANDVMGTMNTIESGITSGDYQGAAQSAEKAASTAKSMRAELDGPLWTVASVLPVVGGDVQSVRRLSVLLDDVSNDVLVPLTKVLADVPPSSLIEDGGTINIEALQSLLAAIEQVAPAMQRCTDEVASIPSTSIGAVENLVGKARDKLVSVNALFQQAAAFAPIVAPALGAYDDRAYLLVAQNSAEIRCAGGFPGAAGILRITDGEISLSDFGNCIDMIGYEMPPSIEISQDAYDLFTYNMLCAPPNVGFDPYYPMVGEVWAEAYSYTHGGAYVDGVIAVTPSVVQDLLTITGPVELSDGTVLTGDNATRVLEHELYWQYFADDAATSQANPIVDSLFSEAATLTFDRLLENITSDTLTKLLPIMTKTLDDRRIMVWMADADEQAIIANAGFAGALNSDPQNPQVGTYYGIWVPSKLGWYADMDTQIGEGSRNADGSMSYKVTTTVRNVLSYADFEEGGEYIMGETDGNLLPHVYLFAPAGGSISDVSASNGWEILWGEYQGLQVAWVNSMSLPTESEVTFTYTITTASGVTKAPTLSATPMLTQYRQ